MKKLLLPLILLLVGVGAGVGAGIFLRDDAEPMAEAPPEDEPEAPDEEEEEPTDKSYVKLSNQFVVPVVEDGLVTALVVMTLSLEVAPGNTEAIYSKEPKIRDAFLQVMFDHANMGGFSGAFTNSATMDVLRKSLRETAQNGIDDSISDVLISNIVRQDV